MIERWENIEGYEGQYEVSDHGRVRSIERIVTHKSMSLKKIPSIERKFEKPTGYCSVILIKKAKRNHLLVHRLVAMAFIPNPENKEQVNHKDGNKRNNHVSNLEWMTRSENVRHAHAIGLFDKKIEAQRKKII